MDSGLRRNDGIIQAFRETGRFGAAHVRALPFKPVLFKPVMFEPVLYKPVLFKPALFEPVLSLLEGGMVGQAWC